MKLYSAFCLMLALSLYPMAAVAQTAAPRQRDSAIATR